ncbi:MAG: hypothetical protein NZM38_00690 [Cytophagales bacterium]|nr:hypothetical protein [Cytophagales bacterium]MDW8383264.1 hypothetical protein [Flammeovirgaceae bacterium]
MKIIFFLVLFSVSFKKLLGQDYYVLQVSGKIRNLTAQQDLEKGSTLKSSDKLRFFSTSSYAVVLDKHAGRKIIDGHTLKKEPSKNELIAFVNDVLVPTVTNRQLSTRHSSDHEITDLQAYFGKGKFLFLGDTFIVKLSSKSFQLDSNRIIAIRYYYEDQSIYKRVSSYENNWLIFDKKFILTNDSVAINPHHVKQCELIYFDKTTKEKKELARFEPLFASDDQIFKDLLSIKSFLQHVEEEKLKSEVLEFVRQNYGKTDELILESWLKKQKFFE